MFIATVHAGRLASRINRPYLSMRRYANRNQWRCLSWRTPFLSSCRRRPIDKLPQNGALMIFITH
jgi:hypothetical protein